MRQNFSRGNLIYLVFVYLLWIFLFTDEVLTLKYEMSNMKHKLLAQIVCPTPKNQSI